MRRSTWRGSPAQAASNRKYWVGVALNTSAMLTFTGLCVWFAIIAIDHLG